MPLKTALSATARGAEGAAVLDLSGWQLVTPGENRHVLVPETGLKAARRGLSVVRPDCTVRSWPWAEVTALAIGVPVTEPEHGARRLVRVEVGGTTHTFVSSDGALGVLRSRLEKHAPHLATSLPRPEKNRRLRWVARAGDGIARARRETARLASILRAAPGAFRRGRLTPVGSALGTLALLAGALIAGTSATGGTVPAASRAPKGSGSIMSRMARFYDGKDAVDLPPATTPPAPAPPTLAGSPPLASHEIFGFAPYWSLPEAGGFDLHDLTTLAYFSVDVNADGSIAQSGPGWAGYESQDLADLITQAHQAGVRVVLTATCFDAATLSALTSSPTAAATLASALTGLLGAKNLDGVNFDFEGQGSEDQLGLDRLIAQVSGALHGVDPHWQVTMDTYSSSAGDPGGFYDISGLAQSVDAFFVMAYDMYDPSAPSPNSALTGQGFSDLDALKEYTSVVPPSKVILGVPYYGYDWPTAGPAQGDPATGPPTPVSYAQIISAGHPVYWDPSSQTPWTSYQVGTQWHQTWFDDPTSLALKAQLANSFHIAGLGVWALGMDGNDPAMMAALLGNAPAVKNFQPSPAPAGQTQPAGVAQSEQGAGDATTTTAPSPGTGQGSASAGAPGGPSVPSALSSAGYDYSGSWDQQGVALDLLSTGMTPTIGLSSVGELTSFRTDDPAFSCLEQEPPLPVYPVFGTSDLYVVEAQGSEDCARGTWEFVAPQSGPGSSGASAGAGAGSQSPVQSSLSPAISTAADPSRGEG